jgi:hypothetical protein
LERLRMNERIEKLAEQAGIQFPNNLVEGVNGPGVVSPKDKLAKFAELIVKECAKVAWYHTPDTEELEYSHLIEDKILEHFGVK